MVLKCARSFYLTLLIYISGGNKQFIYIEWSSSLLIFKNVCGGVLFYSVFVASQFISLNYFAPI